jgi:hypothetical protein
MNKRFRLGPPKQTLAQRSGKAMKAMGLLMQFARAGGAWIIRPAEWPRRESDAFQGYLTSLCGSQKGWH